MKNFKSTLLAATIVAGSFSGVANAQLNLPEAEITGVGASTVSNTVVQSLNCIGNPGTGANPLGLNDGTTRPVAEPAFTQTTPTPINPNFNCATQEMQDDFSGRYVSTGSGLGREVWREFSLAGNFDGSTGRVFPSAFGPAPANATFAFSEAAASSSDLTTYNSLAKPTAGNAIQIPLYVVPIAVAYNPVYGVRNTGSGNVDLTFNVKVPTTFKNPDGTVTPTGGLRLSRSAYCKIFNGEITNFNDPALRVLNGNQSLQDLDDDANRWNTEGVPIRLAGRLDNSGGTDVFTRALAAQCDGFVAVNKFDQNAEALPYNHQTATFDLTFARSDTPYTNNPSDADFTDKTAGTMTALSGAVYRSVGGVFQIDTSVGAEQPGLFLVADGSSRLRDAINFGPDKPASAGVTLNGKIGYIGADFVVPATTAENGGLFSAALQQGASATYLAPNAANATKAFGTILPPDTTASSGAYNLSDPRPFDRQNPLDWFNILYFGTSSLAAPTLGYPITGSAQILTYTCFADQADRHALTNLIALTIGKQTKTEFGSVSTNTFRGTAPTGLGIIPQSGLAVVPAAWQNAIAETFLKRSTQDGDTSTGVARLGDLQLYIQDKIPLKTSDVDGNVVGGESNRNPTCTLGTGA